MPVASACPDQNAKGTPKVPWQALGAEAPGQQARGGGAVVLRINRSTKARGAGGRLPKARRGRGFNAIHHNQGAVLFVCLPGFSWVLVIQERYRRGDLGHFLASGALFREIRPGSGAARVELTNFASNKKHGTFLVHNAPLGTTSSTTHKDTPIAGWCFALRSTEIHRKRPKGAPEPAGLRTRTTARDRHVTPRRSQTAPALSAEIKPKKELIRSL